MLTQLTASESALVKPLRLNFAGWCLYCDEQGCTKSRCIELHARSRWLVCNACGGNGFNPDDDITKCSRCAHGLMETFPADTPDVLIFDAPVSVPPVFLAAPLPRCLGCGHRTADAHPDCAPDITGTAWTPCTDCFGRRVDGDGFECQLCCGAGFLSTDSGHTDTLAERAGDARPW